MSTAQPRAIISPSVLASNFADLGNEIRRMQKCGAEWVHMGQSRPSFVLFPPSLAHRRFYSDRCHGRSLCTQYHDGASRTRERQQGRRERLHGLPHDGRRTPQGQSFPLPYSPRHPKSVMSDCSIFCVIVGQACGRSGREILHFPPRSSPRSGYVFSSPRFLPAQEHLSLWPLPHVRYRRTHRIGTRVGRLDQIDRNEICRRDLACDA